MRCCFSMAHFSRTWAPRFRAGNRGAERRVRDGRSWRRPRCGSRRTVAGAAPAGAAGAASSRTRGPMIPAAPGIVKARGLPPRAGGPAAVTAPVGEGRREGPYQVSGGKRGSLYGLGDGPVVPRAAAPERMPQKIQDPGGKGLPSPRLRSGRAAGGEKPQVPRTDSGAPSYNYGERIGTGGVMDDPVRASSRGRTGCPRPTDFVTRPFDRGRRITPERGSLPRSATSTRHGLPGRRRTHACGY
jgi:hypothetical protein